ncbi:MAG: hypothetical protein WCV93_00910 [Candidatus Shapirobacteria bacterium]|jgi:hypothetical protein
MIDIKNKYQKYQILIWLGAIVVAMSVIKITYKPDKNEIINQQISQPGVTIALTPTVEPEPPITEPETNYDEDFPLWQLLPYSGAGFTVDRYLSPKTLGVKIKGIDKKIVEERIKTWLLQNKIEEGSHKIEYLN